MGEKILLVRHMKSVQEDRLAQNLRTRGYDLDTRWVAQGDRLPAPDAAYKAAVIYGGAQMASQSDQIDYLRDELAWIRSWVADDRPLLGICLGGQLLAKAFGAQVTRHPEALSEIGYVPISPVNGGKEIIPEALMVYQWHKEGFSLPENAELLARGTVYPNQAFRLSKKVYGLQYHPEVTLDMMDHWVAEAGHMLDEPGAQDWDAQLRQRQVYHAPLGDWLEKFLDRWLV
jgi:GMP synthase (glutamine-hydrolysing)|tara:strand:+ start:3767 stop:4456 length:690 start_codon:yes stop_codon:yes gene_type:complete